MRLGGPHVGFLVTHAEAISIADYFTLRDEDSGETLYRPTVINFIASFYV